MIRGSFGNDFSCLLMLENIGSKSRTKIKESELERFFSLNEIIRGVVRWVLPEILRIDVSISDVDIASTKNYISKF